MRKFRIWLLLFCFLLLCQINVMAAEEAAPDDNEVASDVQESNSQDASEATSAFGINLDYSLVTQTTTGTSRNEQADNRPEEENGSDVGTDTIPDEKIPLDKNQPYYGRALGPLVFSEKTKVLAPIARCAEIVLDIEPVYTKSVLEEIGSK